MEWGHFEVGAENRPVGKPGLGGEVGLALTNEVVS